MFDLIVRGGTIVSSDGLTRADIGIADGTIKAVAQAGETLAAALLPKSMPKTNSFFPGLSMPMSTYPAICCAIVSMISAPLPLPLPLAE